MLSFAGSLKVSLAVELCDMRKGFTGLPSRVSERLQENPQAGALFVFINRRHNRLKILFWDRTGLWVCTKRLEQGTFSWSKSSEGSSAKLSLSPEGLSLLTDGVDLWDAKLRPSCERECESLFLTTVVLGAPREWVGNDAKVQEKRSSLE